MKVLAIERARRFSPNSVEKDKAIMDAVAGRLRERGHDVAQLSEEALAPTAGGGFDYELVLTMGRLPQTLRWLKGLSGVAIVNSPEGVERCCRSQLAETMSRLGVPTPPPEGSRGYWLKRGDTSAQEPGDVVFAADSEALALAIDDFRRRGVESYVVSAHVEGDLVKFYGVAQQADGLQPSFFRYYYPTDDGQWKFADEARNGTARHYGFSVAGLRRESERLAAAVGLSVYGGDCIVRADGSFCIIDFNDWPSFARCREEAAEAIARLVV